MCCMAHLDPLLEVLIDMLYTLLLSRACKEECTDMPNMALDCDEHHLSVLSLSLWRPRLELINTF